MNLVFLSISVIVASLLTSIISGAFGMAGGMILMGIYAFLLPVGAAMILHAVTQMAANGFRCWLLRDQIYFRGLLYYAVGALVAVSVFFALAFVPSKATLFIILGIVPFLANIVPQRLAADFCKPSHAVLCGLVVVAFQLLAGVAGPLLDVFFVRSRLNRHEVVATKAMTQTISHFLKLVYFVYFASAQTDTGQSLPAWLFVASIAATVGGTLIGAQILEHMSDHVIRKWSNRIMQGIGAVYLAKGITLLF